MTGSGSAVAAAEAAPTESASAALARREVARRRISPLYTENSVLAQHDLGVVAGRLGDSPAEGTLGLRPHRADLATADQLAEHDRHLELGEGGAEAAPHPAAEGDPGVGAGRRLEEALGLKAVRVGIDPRVAVDQVDAGRDGDSGRQLVAADLDRLRQPPGD